MTTKYCGHLIETESIGDDLCQIWIDNIIWIDTTSEEEALAAARAYIDEMIEAARADDREGFVERDERDDRRDLAMEWGGVNYP